MHSSCSDSLDGVGIIVEFVTRLRGRMGWQIVRRSVQQIPSRGRSVGDIKLLEIYSSVLNRDTVLRTTALGLFVYSGRAREVK